MKSSEQWSSRLAFIWVTSGAAVGLGNIWLFSYMAGQNGGGLFVLTFLLCILFIGIPAMIAEVLAGALAGHNAIEGLKVLAQRYQMHRLWSYVGWLGALALLMILSFYSVVAGWSLGYLGYALTGSFQAASQTDIPALWATFIQSPSQLLVCHTLFMLMTLGIVAKGVQAGIERASKLMMPGLILILAYLVIYAAYIGDFKQGWDFLFRFNWAAMTPQVLITAMGQAFFSLALGAGALFVYGAYLPSKTPFVGALCFTAVLNTGIAILAGLAIFPLVFKFGLAPASGPGLMFQVLPTAFSQMPGGGLVAVLFFVLLIFAALTSTFSLAEPLVFILIEKFNVTRKQASFLVGLIAWGIGITALLSFNRWESVLLFNRYTFFDVLTQLPINLLIPIGGLAFALIAAWQIPKAVTRARLQIPAFWFKVWLIITRFITPVGIVAIFIFGLLS